jgi:hypothetical protein
LFTARAADFAAPLASYTALSLLDQRFSAQFLYLSFVSSRQADSVVSADSSRSCECCNTLRELLMIRQELVGRFAKESRNAGGLCPFSDLKLGRRPTHSALPMAPLPSISEIPFLGSCFPDSKYLRDLRALRGEEIVSAVAPLQRMQSNGQAFKPTRRGDRSPIK